MKAFLEEYGRFIVATIIGIALLGLLYGSTVQNTKLMQRLVPDEENMALEYLNNEDVVETDKIPIMNIAETIVVLTNPNNPVEIDYMSNDIVHSVYDGDGGWVTLANYIPMADARSKKAMRAGRINIIGYDAVNVQTEGDYKVTYQYENPKTGYKNSHDLIVCVRRPYVPHEYIQTTGNQYIDTGILPVPGLTKVAISYQPVNTGTRQDIIWTTGSSLPFGIYIANNTWWVQYGKNTINTGIAVTTSRHEIVFDTATGKFSVDNGASVTIPTVDGMADGYIQIFKNGQDSGKLYSIDFYNGKELKGSMFPAYSKYYNRMGLWDSVQWTPLFNASGNEYPTFKYGKEVDE